MFKFWYLQNELEWIPIHEKELTLWSQFCDEVTVNHSITDFIPLNFLFKLPTWLWSNYICKEPAIKPWTCHKRSLSYFKVFLWNVKFRCFSVVHVCFSIVPKFKFLTVLSVLLCTVQASCTCLFCSYHKYM